MKLIKKVVRLMLFVIVLLVVYTAYQGWNIYKDVTEQMSIDEKIAQIKAQQQYTLYEDLADTYVDAVIAAEDRRFRLHGGVDIISTGRAIVRNLQQGQLVEGGSTITQQLARNMYFEQDKQLSRKIAEVLVALELEKEYEKNQIFELYVNIIYFGSGYYNIRDASQGYFGKEPWQLDDCEATMLAGIPNAPSVYSPDVNPDLAEQRRQQVITCMIEQGYIEEGEIQ